MTKTIKTVIFGDEDKYRKQKMVEMLRARGMMGEETANYVLKGIR